MKRGIQQAAANLIWQSGFGSIDGRGERRRVLSDAAGGYLEGAGVGVGAPMPVGSVLMCRCFTRRAPGGAEMASGVPLPVWDAGGACAGAAQGDHLAVLKRLRELR